MIVADTSALITLVSANILTVVLEEFDVHTSGTVVQELEDTTKYDNIPGEAAEQVLQHRSRFTVHGAKQAEFQSSRIDKGECCVEPRLR